jgi:hypothetical protein
LLGKSQGANELAWKEPRELYFLCGRRYATMEALYSVESVRRSYLEDHLRWQSFPRVETGSNTSTVTLRVVRDETGSLKSETVKYGRESQENRTLERLRWRGSAADRKDRPVLLSEKASHKNKTVTVKQ